MASTSVAETRQQKKKKTLAYTIVFGNEKGGSGKTTTSMHVIVALMRAGFKVGSLDLDGRQKTLTRYIDNRTRWIRDNGHPLCLPDHETITSSTQDSTEEASANDRLRLHASIESMACSVDFIVIDCPGSDAPLSRFAHEIADTLITPLNDSFADLDVIVEVAPKSFEFLGSGIYSKMVMEQRKKRFDGKQNRGLDWILMRNRLSSINSRNKTNLGDTITKLSKVMGCRVAKGVSERVIFRELFLLGLTVLDVHDPNIDFDMSMSHVAARQEMRQLLETLWLPNLSSRLDKI